MIEKMIDCSEIDIVFPNVPTPVWDNGDFWTTISEENGIKLQKNVLTGHARIINQKKIRIAWGNFNAMQDAYGKILKPWKACKKGDVLAVKRAGGLYSHYAVYIGRGNVIHYAAKDRDIGKGACIHKALFSDFIENDMSYEILVFSEDGSRPKHRKVDLSVNSIIRNDIVYDEIIPEFEKYVRKLKGYHIYSPEETVKRAESRLGETKYSLAFNNCEHFALWCKTGIHESTQVEDALMRLLNKGLSVNPILMTAT